jgi:hypothetical protein
MKQKAKYTRELQDISSNFKEGEIYVYHVHGLSQGLGTCKLHKTPDCPHLVYWKPEGHLTNARFKHENIVMKDNRRPQDLGDYQKCKTCWK